MIREVRLFIGGQEIEFDKDPQINLNFKQTELSNPTVVRNSFTKSITVPGTAANNNVFNQIWRLDRYQITGQFNPTQKTDFQLFVDGELFQQGYAKLDKVETSNNYTTYSITLYGGLGQFLYNLTYLEDSNTKRSLNSLSYSTAYLPEPDMDFIINKEAVSEAWGQLTSRIPAYQDRWNVINFAPCYNGFPENFSSDKVLINHSGLTVDGILSSKSEDGVNYRPLLLGVPNSNGYSLGEMSEDMTEWTTFDLRSYLQRPVLSMYRFIQAITRPENNGGWEVKLDSHFFHSDNPYYTQSWVTLNMLTDLDGTGSGESEEISGATISVVPDRYEDAYWYNIDFSSTLSTINNVDFGINVGLDISGGTGVKYMYSDRNLTARNTITLQGHKFIKEYKASGGVVIQLFGYGDGGEIVAQSKAYLLASTKDIVNSKDPLWKNFWQSHQSGNEPEYEFISGYWTRDDNTGKYYFCQNGQPYNLRFNFNPKQNITRLVFKVKTPESHYYKYVVNGKDWDAIYNSEFLELYDEEYINIQGNYQKNYIENLGRALFKPRMDIDYFKGIVTDSSQGLHSGSRVSKEFLLSGDLTPCDYLLSFCKMFGLYFYYDSTEKSSDPATYPAGVVHIMDRDSFFDTDDVIDLSDKIDYSKKLQITPCMAKSKWYSFKQEQIDSETNTLYKEKYGYDYGQQIIDVNYNYNSDTTSLYDGNVFRAGVMAQEKDKYYKKPEPAPNYVYNGLTQLLFALQTGNDGYDTVENKIATQTTDWWRNINSAGLPSVDCFPKLVCHTEENSPSDGQNVLLFLSDIPIETTAEDARYFNYWLTDDISDMMYMNDGDPCWILTQNEYDGAGHKIAIATQELPNFTRQLTMFHPYRGYFAHTFDFGHPRATFVPDTYTTENDDIYDKCWKKYISDLYNENTKKLSCYVRAVFDGKPWPYWFRRFYWFDNAIWVLNEITDLKVGNPETTKMEFIKVQDRSNYKLNKIKALGSFEIELDTYEIGSEGGYINGIVSIGSGGGWYATDWFMADGDNGQRYGFNSYDVIDPHSKTGQRTAFTLHIPKNEKGTGLNWEITLEDDSDQRHTVILRQRA